jgi:hypothetical protein
MSSSALPYGGQTPATTGANALGPTRTPAFEKRLAQRYRAERNFRLLGLSAVVFSVAVLVFLLGNMLINGIGGFQRAELTVTINFPESGVTGDAVSLTAPSASQTLEMQGQQVFRWAVGEMAKASQRALDVAGVAATDLDAFIPHQANMRIPDAMVRALKLPEHVPVARDIAYTGNTSAASVPLAMQQMLDSGEAPHGGTALLIGFGLLGVGVPAVGVDQRISVFNGRWPRVN